MEHLSNLFEDFFLKSNFLLKESTQSDTITLKANFELCKTGTDTILIEANSKYRTKRPWGSSEDWLDTNPKIEKNYLIKDVINKKRIVYHSFILNLLPATESGINVCACASADCARTCLHQSGNIGMLADKTKSRFRKTWFLYLDTDEAVKQIVKKIQSLKVKKVDAANNDPNYLHYEFVYDAEGNKIVKKDKNGKDIIHKVPARDKFGQIKINPKTKQPLFLYKKEFVKEPIKNAYHILVIRLNGTSDLNWLTYKVADNKNIFEYFPDVIFYDYTKNAKVMESFLSGSYRTKGEYFDFPKNYHVTFSYGGDGIKGNKLNTQRIMDMDGNVAIAFAPGKTTSLEYPIFPTNMNQLFQNFKYPYGADGSTMSGSEQIEYKNSIMNEIKKKGFYVSSGELKPFAGKTLLPGLCNCKEVIDGDTYDGRFLDDYYYHKQIQGTKIADRNFRNFKESSQKKPSLVIGLTAKGPLTFDYYDKDKGWEQSKKGLFVVGPNDDFLNTSSCSAGELPYTKKYEFLLKKTEIYKKIVNAIFIIRNRDARHISTEQSREGKLDVRKTRKVSLDSKAKEITGDPKEAETIFTYHATKARFEKEMDDVRKILKCILDPKSCSLSDKNYIKQLMQSKTDSSNKYKEIEKFAKEFRDHIDERIARGDLRVEDKEKFAKQTLMLAIMNPNELIKQFEAEASGGPKVRTIAPRSLFDKIKLSLPLASESKKIHTENFRNWLSNNIR